MAIEFQKSEKETTPKTYKTGDTFIDKNGEAAIIIAVGMGRFIISSYKGSRYGYIGECKTLTSITEEEIIKSLNPPYDFKDFTPCDFILTEKK